MPASLEQQLLHAALLCGLVPEGMAAYRLQLFLVANRDLGSRSHQNDLQRALETAVDRKGFFANAGKRGSGEYLIAEAGHREATRVCGPVSALFVPKRGSDFRSTIIGKVGRVDIEIRTRGTKSTVYFNGKLVQTATEACRKLETLAGVRLPTDGDSAVRVLQDFALDNGFKIEFT
jgi:hypothetical protein